VTSTTDHVQVFLASRNGKKLAEMERILTPLVPGVRVLGLDDVVAYEEPVEDRPDFTGNALLKARAGLAATGLPTLADDSGLCVDALHGMPGVLSARWAGRAKSDSRNNELLLEQLADVPDERRGAHFTCVVAFCHPDGTELVVEGRMEGRVIRETRGSGGFGYDVLFAASEHPDRTTAELDADTKDLISHRGRALREIAPQVAAVLRPGG
jgi:XTP/dITP diphosphohydrolase